MSRNNKRQKIKSRLQIIPEIENWIVHDIKRTPLKSRVQGLSDPDFVNVAREVLHYSITRTILREINFALEMRARKYLKMLEHDIRKLSHGAYIVDNKLLTQLLDKSTESTIKEIQQLWTTPNVLSFDNYQYRKTFKVIAEYGEIDAKGALKLRQEITAGLYDAADSVKDLFKLRYPIKIFQSKFWTFLESEILSDVELSNFLRSGKTSKPITDPRNFDKTRDRFRSRHKKRQ